MQASRSAGKYSLNQPYSSGTRFRLYISNNEPAYVYAIGSDQTQQVFKIFPYADNISAVLNYSQNNVAIPDEDHYIEMDQTVGTDYLCVLYSRKELDIYSILGKIEAGYGTFKQKVEKALGNDLVSSNNVNYNSNTISFQAKSQGRSVVMLLVETKHVE